MCLCVWLLPFHGQDVSDEHYSGPHLCSGLFSSLLPIFHAGAREDMGEEAHPVHGIFS